MCTCPERSNKFFPGCNNISPSCGLHSRLSWDSISATNETKICRVLNYTFTKFVFGRKRERKREREKEKKRK